MSSEEANTAVIVNGELSVSALAAALKGTHSAEAYHVFSAEESKSSAVATEADWAKFCAAANKIKVRPTLLLDSPEVSPAAAATVIAAIALAVQIADVLWNIFKGFDDKEGRSKWTAQVVGDSRRENPHFNWVIVYTNHSINFQGVRDVDWSVRSVRYGLKVGYITYQLYAFRAGVFTLHGDGGFLNWAAAGNIASADPDSKRPRHITFTAP